MKNIWLTKPLHPLSLLAIVAKMHNPSSFAQSQLKEKHMLTVPNLTSYTILLGGPPSAGELSLYLSIFSTFPQILLGTSLPLDYITWCFKQVHMYTDNTLTTTFLPFAVRI